MNIDILKQSLLNDGLFRKDGNLNSSKLRSLSKKYDLTILEGDSLAEKFYLLYKGMRPACVVCGKPSRFISYYAGYSKTCCKECKRILDKQNLLEKTLPLLREKKEEAALKRKQTCLQKYGVDNPLRDKDIQQKVKETVRERYGTDCVFQSKDFKKKSEATCLEKYGTARACQSAEIKNKIAQTHLSRRGVKTNLLTPEFIANQKQVNLQKYGVEYFNQTIEFKEKYKQTCLSKYGVDNVLKCSEVQDKVKKTRIDRYGTENINSLESIQQKRRETCLRKYGADHPVKNPAIRSKCMSHHPLTLPERKFEEFLKNRNFIFEHNCTLSTENGSKNFDFVIFEEEKPIIAIEIDGVFYHGLLSDSDGKHVRGDSDGDRFSKVPQNCKYLAIDETRIDEGIQELLRILNIDYDQWIQEIIDKLPQEFPYYNYSIERLQKDFKKLCDYEIVNPRGRLADSTIKHFHKSIYTAHIQNLPSPLEAWNNKNLLEKCVKNRFIYASNLSSHSILTGFNVCKLAPKVSVFSASLSKYLISKYLLTYQEVFDPFSGFSGRLLGTAASNKRYIGQDINEAHVREANEIIAFHNLKNVSIVQRDVLDSSGNYECLFTCPPYGDKEHWNVLNDEIEKSCDEWIDECLSRFSCKRYLFVVDKTEKYQEYVKETLNSNSLFGTNREKAILIERD